MGGKPVRKPEHAGTGVLFHFNCELCKNSYCSCCFCRGKITPRHGIMATGKIDRFSIPGTGSWKPTISWGTTGAPTVADNGNVFEWWTFGNVLFLHGRFNITAVNAPSTAAQLEITAPPDLSPWSSAVASGCCMKTYSTAQDYAVRFNSNKIQIGTAAAGAISGVVQTGWHSFFAILVYS